MKSWLALAHNPELPKSSCFQFQIALLDQSLVPPAHPTQTPQAQDIDLFATDTYLFTMAPVAPKVRQPNRFAVSGLEMQMQMRMRMRNVLQASEEIAVG
jgi:hypothetical protein